MDESWVKQTLKRLAKWAMCYRTNRDLNFRGGGVPAVPKNNVLERVFCARWSQCVSITRATTARKSVPKDECKTGAGRHRKHIFIWSKGRLVGTEKPHLRECSEGRQGQLGERKSRQSVTHADGPGSRRVEKGPRNKRLSQIYKEICLVLYV